MIGLKILLLLFAWAHVSTLHAADEINIERPADTKSAHPESSTLLSPKTPSINSPQVITINNKSADSQDDDNANIYLNFENASLASIVNYLGEQKKINIIPHKDLENTKVILTTHTPLTLERAWNVLLTLLEMNGFSLINVNNIYRVVQSANNGLEPLPTYSSGTGTEPEDLPNSDMIVRYIYFFKNIKTDTAKTILGRMLDERNIVDNKDLNACIIKDQCLNIKSAMSIVKELDNTGLREAIEVIPLRWANADNVKSLFNDILGSSDQQERIIRFSAPQQKESAYFSTATKILPEPVKNALILLGTQKNIDKIKTFIYKYIDLPIDDAESRLHVKELRYMRAQDMKPILDGILTPPRGAATEKGLVLEGGYKVFEDVIISAEIDDDSTQQSGKRGGGNRLIIACNRDDWKRIEEFIEKIDKPQPQVAFETMIIDVGIGDVRSLGAQVFNIKGKPPTPNTNIEFMNLSSGVASSDSESKVSLDTPYIELAKPEIAGGPLPASFITLGRYGPTQNENIWAFIKSVINVNNSQIVDQPYIIANNNQQCTISVSKTQLVDGKVVSTTYNPVQQKESLEAKISVDLTPNINLTGIVDLSINISIDEFASEVITAEATRTIRNLKTRVSMAAGEVLVLGGLTKSSVIESLEKTPILGDIPIIGSLFRNKEKKKEETNLYVFIRPSIIKPQFEGAPDEYTQLKLDYAKYQIMKNDMYIHDRDPVQRWFFKPAQQTVKHSIADAARGIHRPIDDFTYGRNRPKSVKIEEDPYFRVSEAVAKQRTTIQAEKAKFGQIKQAVATISG